MRLHCSSASAASAPTPAPVSTAPEVENGGHDEAYTFVSVGSKGVLNISEVQNDCCKSKARFGTNSLHSLSGSEDSTSGVNVKDFDARRNFAMVSTSDNAAVQGKEGEDGLDCSGGVRSCKCLARLAVVLLRSREVSRRSISGGKNIMQFSGTVLAITGAR